MENEFRVFIIIIIAFLIWFGCKLCIKTDRLNRRIEERIEKQRENERKEFVENDPVDVYLSQLVENSPNSLIKIGDVYARGYYPYYHSNPKAAIDCYRAAASCEPKITRICEDKILDVIKHKIHDEDDVGAPLPVKYAENAVLRKRGRGVSVRKRKRDLKKMLKPEIDYQNVHDSVVVSNIKRQIETIKDNDNKTYDKINDFKSYIVKNDELSDEDKSNALKVIETLGEEEHSNFKINEKDALCKTLMNIEKNENQDNLKYTLVKNLSSGVDNGVVVCSTGKISRILQVNQFVNGETVMDEPTLKTIVCDVASNVRNKILSSIPNDKFVLYNTYGDDEIGALMKKEFDEEMKDFKEKHKDIEWKIDRISEPIISEF